jgi:ribonucleoside-diphosphate reductase alpha chain
LSVALTMDPFKFIEEVLAFRAGSVPEGLIDEITRRARDKSWSSVLDVAEVILVESSVTNIKLLDLAKDLLLARIYQEAKGDWHKAFPLKGFERKLKWSGLRLLYARYLIKRPDGTAMETPNDMVERVASYVSLAEHAYGYREEAKRLFIDLISNVRFIPNSPTLMNAATRYPQLAACFVVSLADDIDSILEALRVSAWIFKSGAGAGYDFSPLRPRGSPISGTGGQSSGPVSFMKLFDTLADVIKEGGKRRAAMMGILHDWHPDVIEFIRSKCERTGFLENFNISVGVHDVFMEKALKGDKWILLNPLHCPNLSTLSSKELEEMQKLCEAEKEVNAKEILDLIAECAWKSGDPGVIFLDTINKHNATPAIGKIHTTNPCGETPLLDWEACNLGSMNLTAYVDEVNKRILWDELAEDVRLAIRFLDDVIDMSRYPDPKIEEAVRRTRKIGLGVMGWAEFLAALDIPYDSHDALFLADKVMEFIAYHARAASNELARERGYYPAFPSSIHREGRFNFEPQVPASDIYDISKVSDYVKSLVADRPSLDWEELRKEMKLGTRNATVTTIAPTGSISIIAGTSSSIEPFFALVYIRHSEIGSWIEVNPRLYKWLEDNGMLNEDILSEIASHGGGIRWAEWAPEELKKSLPTALEIGWEWHVRMQAVFQRWVDNAVSKTINMPYSVKVEDVRGAIVLAWKLGCKGITVFRDKSRADQVLEAGEELKKVLRRAPKIKVHKDKELYNWLRIGKREMMVVRDNYAGGCPTCDI